MPYRTYQEVARLNASAQRALLLSGDPVERVWAAWALGRTLDAESIPDLLGSLSDSPAPGTRRQLLVVLAGLGERAVLRVYAQDDTEDYVRATACQYLLRISRPADLDAHAFLRERLARDPSPLVRQAILSEPAARLALRAGDLELCTVDLDRDVRQLAIERLLEIEPLERLLPGVLADRIRRETDPDLHRHLIACCCERGGGALLLALAAQLASAQAREILSQLVEAGDRYGWQQLAPLTLARDPEHDRAILGLLHPSVYLEAVPWLVACIARAQAYKDPQERTNRQRAALVHEVAHAAYRALCDLLPQLRTSASSVCDGDALAGAIVQLQEEIMELEAEDDDDIEWDDETWAAEAMRERRALLSALRTLPTAG